MRAGTYSLVKFYERRARRILPALFVILAATLVYGWFWMTPDRFKLFFESLAATSVFLSNFYFMSQHNYFAEAAELQPLLHT